MQAPVPAQACVRSQVPAALAAQGAAQGAAQAPPPPPPRVQAGLTVPNLQVPPGCRSWKCIFGGLKLSTIGIIFGQFLANLVHFSNTTVTVTCVKFVMLHKSQCCSTPCFKEQTRLYFRLLATACSRLERNWPTAGNTWRLFVEILFICFDYEHLVN